MTAIVRLDRFTLPAAARDAFLARVADTHAVLRRQPGFLRDRILERPVAGGIEIATSAEWESEAAVAAAREVVAAWQARAGFDRAAFLSAHGITAEFATFRQLEPAHASGA